MMLLLRILLLLVLSTPSAATLYAQTNFPFFQPLQPARKLQVIVPRGMAMAAPENSSRAIEMCIEDYCEWVEIDVRKSQDGAHVLIRTDTVDPTSNGHGRVNELTLSELKKLDTGTWFAKRYAQTRILTLAEVLKLAKGKINLLLACHDVNPEQLAAEVLEAGMEQQVLLLGSPSSISAVQAASQDRIPFLTVYRPDSGPIDPFLESLTSAAVEIDPIKTKVNAPLCQRFHKRGIKVMIRLLGEERNNPMTWTALIDAGVDWIITDDPAGLLFFSARKRLGQFPVQISAHRGSSRYAPENTLAAINAAARSGLDFAEIDIRTTTDNRHVLLHDNTVNRTTNGTGSVHEMTFAQTQKLSAGTWFGKPYTAAKIPTLEAGLAALKDKMRAYLDAKDIAPEVLVAAIQKSRLTDRHVVFQSVEYCARLHTLDPTVRTLPPLHRLDELNNIVQGKPYGVDASWSILSQEMIAACHQKGIKVFSDALGLNETVDQYRQAIQWGIDCIQTDHPLKVLRAIEVLRESAPKP